MDRVYDRLRHPSAFEISRENSVSGAFDQLRGHKYGLLVTFRRNGDAVPSPVWMAIDDQGRAYVQTGVNSGKVKRLRNDADVLIAASTVRGRPTGPMFRGSGRILPREEWAHAEATLAGAFGLGRRLYLRAFPMGHSESAYVEVTLAGDTGTGSLGDRQFP